MDQVIINALVHTPWWVYVLFAYLLFIGFRASKTRIIPIYKLFIVPVIFTYLSVHSLIHEVVLNLTTISVWLLVTLISIWLGAIQVRKLDLKYDHQHRLVQLPGSWSTLIYVLIIFAAKYAVNYEAAVDPEALHSIAFDSLFLAISAFASGVFVGKIVAYMYRLSTVKSEDLSPKT